MYKLLGHYRLGLFRRLPGRIALTLIVALLVLCTIVFTEYSQVLVLTSGAEIHREALFQAGFKHYARQSEKLLHPLFAKDSQRSAYNHSELVRPRGHYEKLRYLVVVSSAFGNSERRRAIRDSWAKTLQAVGDSRVIFLLGLCAHSCNSKLQDTVKREMVQFGDILQFDFADTYRNMTLKSTLMLRWASQHKPTYLVKTDDDVMINFVQLRRTLDELRTAVQMPFIAGKKIAGAVPYRSKRHKWYVSTEEYPDEVYPDYIKGCLYAISGELLATLYDMALRTRTVSMEDIFVTGILATKASVPRFGLVGIAEYYVDSCAIHEMLMVHEVPPDAIQEYDQTLRSRTRHCSTLFGLRLWCFCTSSV